MDLIKETLKALESINRDHINMISEEIIQRLKRGGKILVCGNGGSNSDASHFVGELLGRYLKNDAKPLPAILLTTGDALGSAISNDFGYDYVFSRQVEGLAKKDDVLICISTSGRSRNILNALKQGINQNIYTILLTSKLYKTIEELIQVNEIKINSSFTPSIQHAHIFVLHLICQKLEEIR